MSLPASKSEINRLGRKLANGGQLTDAENDLWLEVLLAYDSAVCEVQHRLLQVDLIATGRVKETPSLAEKLKRQPTMQLLNLDDVGGVRIVCKGGLAEQDMVVAGIERLFNGELAKGTIDRRATPSHGYRAVHVVVKGVDGLRVEVQVRTELQDLWAQVIEALGTKWGRELRYGEPIQNGEMPIFPGAEDTRTDFYGFCRELGDVIAEHELNRMRGQTLRDSDAGKFSLSYLMAPPMAVRQVSMLYQLGRLERDLRRSRSSIKKLLQALIGLATRLEGGP